MKLVQVVATYELAPIHPTDGAGPLRFRIEILRTSDAPARYGARLLRWETFSLTPRFSSTGMRSADEELVVGDAFWDSERLDFDSERSALDAVLQALDAQLGPAGIRG